VYQGRFKEARHEYLEALKANTSETPAQKENGYFLELCLGLLEDRLQHYDEAVRHFEQSLKFSPTTLRIYRDLGATNARMGRIVKAQKIVDSVLVFRAGKNHRYYNHVMGEILLAQKKYQEAITFLTKSCGDVVLQSSLYCYPLSRAYILNNNPLDAIKVLEDIIKARLTLNGLEDYQLIFYYPYSLYTLAKLYEQTGQMMKAVKTYEQFLTIWRNADKDLPELMDAKIRLSKLKGVANK